MLGLIESPVRLRNEFIESLATVHPYATYRHCYEQTGRQIIEMSNLNTVPNLLRNQQRPVQVCGR